MTPSAIFQRVLTIITFIVMIFYIYYFNLLPIGEWLGISPARGITGKWSGTAPQGATYKDYVVNYACSYEANLFLDIEQRNQNITGSILFGVRKSTQKLKGIPCLPTNYSFNLPITGKISGTNIEFSNPGIPGTYSPTKFIGTFTSDIMSGTFERLPSKQDLSGLKGQWQLTKNR